MNNRLNRIIEIAKCLKPEKQNGQHYVVAGAMLGSRLVGLGFNDYTREHPRHKFGEYKPTRGDSKNYKASLHAEISLIKKLKHDPQDLTFYIVRIDNNNQVALARPCKNCFRVFQKKGYRKILYSMSETEFGVIIKSSNLTTGKESTLSNLNLEEFV